jgi:hypothetical protein
METTALANNATISDTDTNMYYLVDNSGGAQNSAGLGVSNGNPATINLPHANVTGRVVVLIATCRTISSTNSCNIATDANSQSIDGSQIIANVQNGDSIVLLSSSASATPTGTQADAEIFTLALFTDGNHHWYLFDTGN